MFQEFMQKLWTIAEPALLAAIAAMFAAALAWLKKHLDAAAQTRVVAETVAAVDQTMSGASGEEKKLTVESLLEDDPRVGSVSDNAIEAAVRMLPPKETPTTEEDE